MSLKILISQLSKEKLCYQKCRSLSGVAAANPLPTGGSLAGLYTFPSTNEVIPNGAGNRSTVPAVTMSAMSTPMSMTTPSITCSNNGATTQMFQPNSDLSSLGLTTLPSELFDLYSYVINCPLKIKRFFKNV